MIWALISVVLLLSLQATALSEADQLFAARRYAEAAESYLAMVREDPDNPAIRVRLGASQYQLGDFEASAMSFRSVLKSHPENARALAGLGMSLNSLDRPAEARPVLERAVKRAPSDRMSRLALANSFTELGEFLRADELLRLLTDENQKDWEAWYFLAALRFRNNYHQQALEALDRCLTLRPGDRDTRILRVRSIVKLGRLPEAAKVLQELSADPEVAADWEFLLGHAEYSFNAGDLATALAKIDDAISRKPRSGMLHYWKARILHHSGDIAAAQVEAERSVALVPDLREPRGLLARIYRLEGKEAEAAEQIEWLRDRELEVARGRRP